MADPFLGEIKIIGFNFAPRGWGQCNGQILSIAQNTALFSLLGTTYGGNGQTTFALPDLRGRLPVGVGTQNVQGEASGTESVTLIQAELPSHSHAANCQGADGTSKAAVGNFWAKDSANNLPYKNAATAGSTMATNPSAVGPNAGNQPHSNLAPYLTVNFCIALVGVFPSRP